MNVHSISPTCHHHKTSSSPKHHLHTYGDHDHLHTMTIANTDHCKQKTTNNMPSRWYTVLALPFPDQKLGRRDINTFGRGVYSSRAGFFSNPPL